MKLVSACLLGVKCNYKGDCSTKKRLEARLNDGDIVPFCPELLGGLSIPRDAAEIIQGDGHDVLKNTAYVQTVKGAPVTGEFVSGAYASLKLAKAVQPDEIILKSLSPSCGLGFIYDGTFSDTLREGDGVCAALLKKEGFNVVCSDDYT